MPRRVAAAALCALAAVLCAGGEPPSPRTTPVPAASAAGEPSPREEAPSAPRAREVPWERLVFEDANALTSVRTAITVASLSAEEAGTLLIAAPGGDGLPVAGERALALSADIEADNRLLADKSWRGLVWIRPDGTALQRIRDKRAPDRNRRTYRFTPTGVFRIRAEPDGAAEEDAPPASWTDITEKTFSYGAGARDCARVSDPAALLFLLSRDPPAASEGARRECVFNKKTLYRAEIEPAGHEAVSADHAEERDGARRSVEGTRRALRLRIRARPLGAPDADERFEFLGIEGDVELLLEEPSGLPLRIRGRIPDFGDADFALTSARFPR